MGYSHAVRHSVLNKVLQPEGRSIVEVSRETGVNQQTIRNWIKRSETGIVEDRNSIQLSLVSLHPKRSTSWS